MITSDQLKHIAPHCKNPEMYTGFLNTYMPKYEINNKQRICYFISQCAHESSSFNDTLENANPGHKPGEQYEGRKDLGNSRPGYGVKFPGRGLIQLTGYNMYHDCSAALFGDNTLLLTPELLEQPDHATESACWFWQKVKKLNEICDLPDNWIKPGQHGYTKSEWITILINGGLNGYAQRMAFLKLAEEIIL